jgi:hypothetical protein
MFTSILELEARASDKVLDGAEDFAGSSER